MRALPLLLAGLLLLPGLAAAHPGRGHGPSRCDAERGGCACKARDKDHKPKKHDRRKPKHARGDDFRGPKGCDRCPDATPGGFEPAPAPAPLDV